MQPRPTAGATKALFDAVSVAAIFNFFNRWIDGTGVSDVPRGFYEGRLAAHGDMGVCDVIGLRRSHRSKPAKPG